MLKAFFLYGMPLYITVIEALIKQLVDPAHNDWGPYGPTVAVAGIALIVPVLIPKRDARIELPDGRLPEGFSATVIVRSPEDQKVIEAGTIALFVLLALWGVLIFLAHKYSSSIWVFVGGLAIYAIGTLLTMWKERV